MVRDGPCCCPTCPKKHESLGQWTLIPRAFKDAHPELQLAENACVNRKAPCHEWCGLKEPATKGRPPGGKKAKLNEPAVAVAVQEAESLPYPRAIKAIDEIWGVRYAATRTHTDSPASLHAELARARGARRYAPIEAMSATKRGNKLPFPPAESIEYAVHGVFLRADPDDVNGTHGCWWVPLKMMVKAYGKEDLKPLLEQFEHDLKEAREEAYDECASGEDSDAEY